MEKSISIMIYESDMEQLDRLLVRDERLNDSVIHAGRTHKDADARKRLIGARKDMLHKLISEAPAQLGQIPGENIKTMSDAELVKAYEEYPANSAIVFEIVQRWTHAKKEAQLPLAHGDDVYYADTEYGYVEHGTVSIASYKDGLLDSFSVNFDGGDFDEFAGEALGCSLFKDWDNAAKAVKNGSAALPAVHCGQ